MITTNRLVEAFQVSRRGDAPGQWLLHDVTMHVAMGERLVVVGHSGSGKTLLLRALSLLDRIEQGAILWRGQLVQGDKIPEFRSRVIYLHQRPPLGEGTVEDNLKLPMSFRVHAEHPFRRDQIISWLEILHRPATFLDKQSRDLSGGEAQLTALLRAIQLDPDVLLLDEPTSALDQQSTEAVETLITTWQAEEPGRRSLVLVTHDSGQASRMQGRIVRMESGRISHGE